MKAALARSVLLTCLAVAALASAPAACPAGDAAPRGETVVLLHGLGRTGLSMWRMEEGLERAGYRVVNLTYPSTEKPVEELAEILWDELHRCCREASRLHFVTHSLGGIVVRFHLADRPPPQLGRVVMLSPPNQGTEVVDQLRDSAIFRNGAGPAAGELGTEEGALPARLGPVAFELGVITGDRSLNPLFSRWIAGADDGMVSVESARVPGMKDFLVLPHTHTFIMMRTDAIAQTLYFLEHGTFERSAAEG